MALRDNKFKKIYRSQLDNIVDDFLKKVLKDATYYERGTGYFSLSSIAALAEGITSFVRNNGTIKIITSVQMSSEDVMVIRRGLEIQKNTIIEKLEKLLHEKIEDEKDILRLDLITNLIACDRLKIKIAYMPKGGIYHEKFGILFDENDAVYFMGSPNETFSGLIRNFESIMVLSTWADSRKVIDAQHDYFQNLWDDRIDGIEVFSFPEALQKNLLQLYKVSPDVETAIKRMENGDKEETNLKQLYPYQLNAIKEFKNNGYCHFFEMATGTGKTFTAVKAYEQIKLDIGNIPTLILVPQIDLQSHWLNAFQEINITPLLFGGLANSIDTSQNISLFVISTFDKTKPSVAIAIYNTFFSDSAYNSVKGLSCSKFIIVDEAHNLSPKQIRKLPLNFDYRLGLSATPERYDKKTTNDIINYFTLGKIDTFKYTIEEAISAGFLSHYEYIPIPVHLTDSEFREYKQKSRQYSIARAEKEPDKDKIKDILMKRSSIIKKSTNKLKKLISMVTSGKYDFNNSVVYCGNGKDADTDLSIIDLATEILTVNGNYKVSQFTSKTSNRVLVLNEFEKGNFDVLTAIKCFDEGVDVPKLDKIYIMSSDGLKRQTIQRRGRVLRKCKESGKVMAHIFDFVAIPPDSVDNGESGCSTLVRNELRRVIEYGRLADNKECVNVFIREMVNEFGADVTEVMEEREEDIYYGGE